MEAMKRRGGVILGPHEGTGMPAARARFNAFLVFVASFADSFTGSTSSCSASLGEGVDPRVGGSAVSSGTINRSVSAPFSIAEAGSGAGEIARGAEMATGVGNTDGDMDLFALRREALDEDEDEAEDIILAPARWLGGREMCRVGNSGTGRRSMCRRLGSGSWFSCYRFRFGLTIADNVEDASGIEDFE